MTPVPPATASATSRLVRPRYPRLIAGVCAGFAEHYGWDLSVVRVVTVVLAFLTGGISVLFYVAAWVLIPEAAYTLPPQTTGSSTI
jgi:phage shock protein PspC (stress-responsive transcriptional regulator)